MNKNAIEKDVLPLTLKSLLNQEVFRSQTQIVKALSIAGFENVTQSKVSRLLDKMGAIKIRNEQNNAIYKLPNKQNTPRISQAIDSVILEIKHNNVQIIIKTVKGGATLIANIIDVLGESHGILACMANDNILLVIPTDIKKIDLIIHRIQLHLNLPTS